MADQLIDILTARLINKPVMQLQASLTRELSFTNWALLFLSLVFDRDMRFNPLLGETLPAIRAGSFENRYFSAFSSSDAIRSGGGAFVASKIARLQESSTTLWALRGIVIFCILGRQLGRTSNIDQSTMHLSINYKPC